MKRGQVTFLIIPQGRHTVRELRLSAGTIKVLASLFAIVLVSTLFLGGQYIDYRKQQHAFAELEEAYSVQRDSFRLLAEKVSHVERRIAELNDFDRKIRIISNLDLPDETTALFGVGGSIPEEEAAVERLSSVQKELIAAIHQDIDQLLEETSLQERSFRELVEYLKTQKSILARTPSIWPVMGWVTSEFGYRRSPFTDHREFHNGIDIATRQGTEIVAPADGVVKTVARDRYMGNYIWIDHGDDVLTCYGHLRDHAVEEGQKVKRADVIGTVGNTGRSTGPHLHYGVMLNGTYVNPRRYLF